MKCQQWNSRGDNQYAYVQKQDQMPNNKLFKSDNIYFIMNLTKLLFAWRI